MNGAIRRHFGKHMNEKTKLRIHNIAAKAALFRSTTDEIFETSNWNNKNRFKKPMY